MSKLGDQRKSYVVLVVVVVVVSTSLKKVKNMGRRFL